MSVDANNGKRSLEEADDTLSPPLKKHFEAEPVHSYSNKKKFEKSAIGEGEVDYIECPIVYKGARPLVFLAGGISNCPDWQTTAKDLIHKKCPGLIPVNPRRSNFDVKDPNVHHEQIKWEFDALRQSEVIIFWFPKETLCPITLYELGTWSILHKYHGSDIIVGCDPGYARIEDVKTQLNLATGTEFPVHTTVEDLIDALQVWWDDHTK